VATAAANESAGPVGVIPSPVRGPAGNVEFLLHAVVGKPGQTLDLDGAIVAAQEVA
jgi:hypothetical protein